MRRKVPVRTLPEWNQDGSRQLCIGFGPESYGLDYYGGRRELHCTVSRNSLAG